MKRTLASLLALMALLIALACKTENKDEQQALEALLRQPVGNFKLTKSYSATEARGQASGFVSNLVKGSTAVAGGEFLSPSNEKVVVLMTTHPSAERASELVQTQHDIFQKAKEDWDSSTLTPFINKSGKETGKKLYAVDGMRHGVFIWNDGPRLFLVGSESEKATQDFYAALPY